MNQEPKGTIVYETGFIDITFDMVPDPASPFALLHIDHKTPLQAFTEQVWSEEDPSDE